MTAKTTVFRPDASAYRRSHWRDVNALSRRQLPNDMQAWVLDQGSLTRRLIEHCRPPFQVQVQSQGYGLPRFNERQALDLPNKQYCLIRQVLLVCDSTPMVFARTVVPLATLTGRERRLCGMGSRSLGAALFADPSMRRDSMQIAKIKPGDYFYQQACLPLTQRPDHLWGRRSVFYLNRKKLLVSEFFLPTIALCKRDGKK